MTSPESLDRPIAGSGNTGSAASTLKRVAAYVVLVTVVPFAILLAIEGFASIAVMARHAATTQPPARFPNTVHDTLLGWVGRPNLALPNAFGPGRSLTHDARGMRVHPSAVPDSLAGDHRIVCSGGTLAYGAGVADDETMCADLERELPGVRTLDLAEDGFGIDQAYLRFVRDGAGYSHRLHLVAFTQADIDRVVHDTERGYLKPVLSERNGRLVAENVPVANRAPSRWSESSVLSESRLARAIERRTGWSDASRARDRARAWALAQTVFRDLDSLDRVRGSRAVLVYLPTLAELRPGANDARRAALASFGGRAGIPVIDLTAEMRALSPDTADWLFITPNALPVHGFAGHYSAEGHRWVAARIAEHLRAMPELARALEPARR